MFNEIIMKNFPFVSNYFLEAKKQGRFPQSIVFEGLNPYAQLFFALECARLQNCLKDGEVDCDCLNCRWIRQNSHPAVIFVSQMHFKPQGDDSKTVISAKQAKAIEKEIRETSDYHRFFIFFDAKEQSLLGAHKKSHDDFCPEGYSICPNEDWIVNSIDKKTFHESAPNILLKSVEEPPERTTFVFLTKNRADLINTIVSRSQVFKLSTKYQKEDISPIEKIFENYPQVTFDDAFLISEQLQNYIKENELNADFVLNLILQYFSGIYKKSGKPEIQKDIKELSTAFLWAKSAMSNKVIFDTLMLKIARNKNE